VLSASSTPVAKPKAKDSEDPSEPPEQDHDLAPEEIDAPPATVPGGRDAAGVEIEDDLPF
jgi:hypothetical protein